MWNHATPWPPTPRVSRRHGWRWWGCAFALAIALVLTACPYSGIPLGDPDPAAFEEGLLGEWVVLGEPGQPEPETETLTVLRFNRAEYLIVTNDAKADSTTFMRAFATRVDHALFLNLQDQPVSRHPGTDSVTYALLRVRLSGDELLLHMVADSVGAPRTSAELNSVLERRLDEAAIYDAEPVRLRRRQP